MPLAQTIARRIRSSVRRRAETLLDRVGLGADGRTSPTANTPARSVPRAAPAAAPVTPEPVIPERDPHEPAPVSDTVGEPLFSRDAVLAVFEDMVRPALQADGGDLELVKIEGPDIYVRLVGACQTCPSSIITMQQGIERLLKEEFEGFGRLIRVDDGA